MAAQILEMSSEQASRFANIVFAFKVDSIDETLLDINRDLPLSGEELLLLGGFDMIRKDWPAGAVAINVFITLRVDDSGIEDEYEFHITVKGEKHKMMSGSTKEFSVTQSDRAQQIGHLTIPEPLDLLDTEFHVEFKVKDAQLNTQNLLRDQLQKVRVLDVAGPYSAWLNVVQSSGTGKTRTMFQLGKESKIPVFYVRGEDRGGYPAHTPTILKFLCGNSQYDAKAASKVSDEEQDVAAYCRAAAFMYEAYKKSVQFQARHSNKRNITDEEWENENKEQWAQDGQTFWDIGTLKDCSARLQQAMKGIKTWSAREDVVYFQFTGILVQSVRGAGGAGSAGAGGAGGAGAGSAGGAGGAGSAGSAGGAGCAGAGSAGAGGANVGDLRFIIVIDECRYLRRRFISKDGPKLDVLTHLGRAARVLRAGKSGVGTGGVMVSMDTLSDVVALSASDRAQVPGSNRQMVFTRLLSWDLNLTPAQTLGQVLSQKHIANCGRPLWSARWQAQAACGGMVSANVPPAAQEQKPMQVVETQLESSPKVRGVQEVRQTVEESFVGSLMFEFIQRKLLCSTTLGEPSPAQAAAILCCRVGLDPNPYSQLARDLVGSHMAHLDFYDFERGFAVTSYLPEAPLACGARALWRNHRNFLVASLKQVNKLIQAREIQPGEGGEVAAQIVVLDALDQVAGREGGVVTVKTFLQELLFGGDRSVISGGVYASMDKCLDAEAEKGSGAAAMLSGVINVVQFVRIEFTPSRTDLYHFFQRGLGVVAKTNAACVDLYLPVMLLQAVEGNFLLDTPTVIEAHAAYSGGNGSGSSDRAPISGVKADTGAQDTSSTSTSTSTSRGGGSVEPRMKKPKTEQPKALGLAAKQPQKKFPDTEQPKAKLPEGELPETEPLDDLHRAVSPNHVTVLALQVKNTQAQDSPCTQKVNPAVDFVRGLGANKPFGFALISFNQSEEVEVYDLPIDVTVPVEDRKEGLYLGVAVSNPHLRRPDGLAEQLAEMVQRVIHPVQLLSSGEDALAMMVEQATRYGTVVRDVSPDGIFVTGHGKLSDIQIRELLKDLKKILKPAMVELCKALGLPHSRKKKEDLKGLILDALNAQKQAGMENG